MGISARGTAADPFRRRDLGELPWRSWFPDSGVLICRPGAGAKVPFAVAIKGGNNGVNHGHSDVGSFSVVSGKTMVICDPGGEVYTARTFSAHRFDSKVLNSFGHARAGDRRTIAARGLRGARRGACRRISPRRPTRSRSTTARPTRWRICRSLSGRSFFGAETRRRSKCATKSSSLRRKALRPR